ncbi:MAG TPA: hypothetical protein P5513_08195 [Candidatus Diapherotrites archaeon]|nr:hypothetical protein [Candidatus Diapherotrites archaeon]HRT03905.1 hypothetical protein [Candidatus Diapherotrites archaeon]
MKIYVIKVVTDKGVIFIPATSILSIINILKSKNCKYFELL